MQSVSIIYTSHNSIHIFESLKSTLAQLKQCDEIIVVDDNSQTNFQSKLASFCDQFNIRLLFNKTLPHNRSHTRNIGGFAAKNEYLIFIDGDVFIPNNFIERFLTETTKKNLSLAGCHVKAMDYSEEQLLLYHGIKIIDYVKNARLLEIEHKAALKDYRCNRSYCTMNSKYAWRLIYSACICVKKADYLKVNGFDTSFKGWGVEDMDFAYSISKIGKVAYLDHLFVWHIAHYRNRYNNMEQNYHNLFLAIKKHQGIIEWEILQKLVNLDEVMCAIDVVKQQFENIEFKFPKIKGENYAIFETMSGNNNYGNLTYYKDNQVFKIPTLGLSIPITNDKIEEVYISQNIFNYPVILANCILQELSRISKKVIILKIKNFFLINRDAILESKFKIQQNIFYTSSSSILDICIEDKGDFLIAKSIAPKPKITFREDCFYE